MREREGGVKGAEGGVRERGRGERGRGSGERERGRAVLLSIILSLSLSLHHFFFCPVSEHSHLSISHLCDKHQHGSSAIFIREH